MNRLLGFLKLIMGKLLRHLFEPKPACSEIKEDILSWKKRNEAMSNQCTFVDITKRVYKNRVHTCFSQPTVFPATQDT